MSYAEVADDDLTEASAFVARSLTEIAGRPVIGVISVPAPAASPESILRRLPRDGAVFWGPAGGTSFAAGGTCVRINLRGADRLRGLRRASDALFAQTVSFRCPGLEGVVPRLVGGIAFAPMGSHGEPWGEFGDGCFTLPRWTYTVAAEGQAWLTLATSGLDDKGPRRRERVLAELDALVDGLLGDGVGVSCVRTRARPARVRQSPYAEWHAHVERIRAEIASGRFEKIVAARVAEVEFDLPADDLDVLARLAFETNSVRFCFRRRASTFLGASPEMLFAKHGRVVSTQALAGTIESFGSEVPLLAGQSRRLLDSRKDLHEHESVVREIRDSLAPLSERVTAQVGPEVQKVRNILHLNTSIAADLHDDVHALDLLAALHPTPAVGGAPMAPAAAWVAANEPRGRGWYTGAVGYFDARGDGTFAVAIRSGVLCGTKAYVYTGAGIVGDSDPRAEYEETALKQQPLLRALGVDEA